MALSANKTCGILYDPKVFGKKCLKIVDVEYFHSICMYDMCLRQDGQDKTPLCRAAAGLAHACTQLGLEKNVRVRDTIAFKKCTGEYNL